MHNHIRAQRDTGQLCTAEAQPSGKSAAGGGAWRTGGRREEPFHGLPFTGRGCSDTLGAPISGGHGLLDPPVVQQRRALAETPRRRGNLGIPPGPQRRHWPMTERHPESLRHPADFASRRQETRQESLTCGAVIGSDRATVPRDDHIHTSIQPQSALIPAPGRQMAVPRTVMASGPGKNLNKANSPDLFIELQKKKKKKPRAFRYRSSTTH